MFLSRRLTKLNRRIWRDLRINRMRRRNPGFLTDLQPVPLETHLAAAMAWLQLSHSVTGGQGSSKGWSYLDGWRPPFPETTGYIVPTFLVYAERAGGGQARQAAFRDQAFRMLDFLCRVQNRDGGVMEGVWRIDQPARSIVFNSGMAMSGWIAGFRAGGGERYLDAACRAGDFLVRIRAEPDLWLEHSYNNIPHTYHARVAWFLARLARITGHAPYEQTARDILDWVVEQQQENGWFEHCHFTTKRPSYNSHAIAYTIRGLLESSVILDEPRYLAAARQASIVVRGIFEASGRLPTLLDRDWQPKSSTECVTGIAQHAIIWMRLHEIEGEDWFLESACRATDLLCLLQDLESPDPEIRGAIKGSHPIYGRYAPFQYPNWAAKFFADALMLRLRLTAESETPVQELAGQ